MTVANHQRQAGASPVIAPASGFEISILYAGGRWTATVSKRTDVAGPGAYRLTPIAVRTATACLSTVLRDASAAILNNLADAETADFLERPH